MSRKMILWSVDVNGPWRILFKWDAEHGMAYDVDLDQPH
jgi:plasmid maintenance system killer protein